jgi:hypothetical protein
LDCHQKRAQKSLSFFLKIIFRDFVAILNFPQILLNIKKRKGEFIPVTGRGGS